MLGFELSPTRSVDNMALLNMRIQLGWIACGNEYGEGMSTHSLICGSSSPWARYAGGNVLNGGL